MRFLVCALQLANALRKPSSDPDRTEKHRYIATLSHVCSSSPPARNAAVPQNPARVGPYLCGDGQPLLWIAGPCVLEDLRFALEIARELKRIAANLPVQLVFKASFDKANRTSVSSYRGPGLRDGLQMLADIGAETALPVTTDIHEPIQ